MITGVSMITYFCLTYRMKVAEYNPEKGITISIDLNSEKLQWYVCKSLACEHESKCIVAAKDCNSSSSSGTQPILIQPPQPHLIQQPKVNCATPLTFQL